MAIAEGGVGALALRAQWTGFDNIATDEDGIPVSGATVTFRTAPTPIDQGFGNYPPAAMAVTDSRGFYRADFEAVHVGPNGPFGQVDADSPGHKHVCDYVIPASYEEKNQNISKVLSLYRIKEPRRSATPSDGRQSDVWIWRFLSSNSLGGQTSQGGNPVSSPRRARWRTASWWPRAKISASSSARVRRRQRIALRSAMKLGPMTVHGIS
jgi:hypothetical protein